MRTGFVSFALAAVSLSGPLSAGDWASIPSEIWAIKEDPSKGLKGALVLEDRISFKGNGIEYRYRVRIFGESGKSAAEFSDFPDGAESFDGRTVYPDGKILAFNQRKDFATKSISVGDANEKRTVIIPPGVTGDCVVELRWWERADEMGKFSPLPKRMGYSAYMQLANRFPTRAFIVEVPLEFKFASTYFPTRSIRPEVTTTGRFRVYTFRDIPAKESIPYGFETAREFPAFSVFYLSEALQTPSGGGGQDFWKLATNYYFKSYLQKKVKKGSAYRALFDEIWTGVEGNPADQAALIKIRMDARIRNLSSPTFAEEGSRKREEIREETNSQDLDETARRGSTDALGMTVLYLHLLLDKGLQAKIAMVVDQEAHLFRFESPNVFQFSSQLVGVAEPNGTMRWVEPSRRYSQPGVIHPVYQDTQALLIDPNDWSATQVKIPAQPSGMNVRKYLVDVVPSEGMDRFSIKASFSGYPEYQERRRFMVLEPKEQNRTLKENLEIRLKSATFARVEVKGIKDAKELVTWEAEGSLEREETRQREVAPFPTIPYALWFPDDYPDERKELILIPYRRTQESTSIIHIPEGWSWNGAESIENRNRYGTVRWVAEKQPGNIVKVVLRVEVNARLESASSYPTLKTFLGWMREASTRTLLLQKNP